MCKSYNTLPPGPHALREKSPHGRDPHSFVRLSRDTHSSSAQQAQKELPAWQNLKCVLVPHLGTKTLTLKLCGFLPPELSVGRIKDLADCLFTRTLCLCLKCTRLLPIAATFPDWLLHSDLRAKTQPATQMYFLRQEVSCSVFMAVTVNAFTHGHIPPCWKSGPFCT